MSRQSIRLVLIDGVGFAAGVAVALPIAWFLGPLVAKLVDLLAGPNGGYAGPASAIVASAVVAAGIFSYIRVSTHNLGRSDTPSSHTDVNEVWGIMRTWEKGGVLLVAVAIVLIVVSRTGAGWIIEDLSGGAITVQDLPGSGGSAADWDKANQLVADGEIAEDEGRTDDALALYSEALRVAPGNTMGWGSKNSLLAGEGRYKEALATAEGWTKQLPKNDWAWVAKGYALEGLGRYQEAIEAYEKAQSVAAEYPNVLSSASATAKKRQAVCQATLDNPSIAAEKAYFLAMTDVIVHIREVNQQGADFLDATTPAESTRLLADYESGLDDSILEATAVEAPPSMRALHSQLIEGLSTMKRGVSGLMTALDVLDSAAMEKSAATLDAGSAMLEDYRQQLVDWDYQ